MEKSGQRLRNFKRKVKEEEEEEDSKIRISLRFRRQRDRFRKLFDRVLGRGGRGEVNSNRDGFVTGNSPLLLICM